MSSNVILRSWIGQIDPDGLGFGKLVVGLHAVVPAAKARLFVSPERR